MAAQSITRIFCDENKGTPEPRVVVLSDVDRRVETVRDRVLQTIRTCMPVADLFRPELRLDLNVFVNDQILFHNIAKFLSQEDLKPEEIAARLEGTELLAQLKGLLKDKSEMVLPLLIEAFTDVLTGKPIEDRMRDAVSGRVFTMKNALMAQLKPEALQQSQTQNGLRKQKLEDIQAEGAAFIRQCLAMHLKMIRGRAGGDFKDELTSVARQLIPFVRQVTKQYLYENRKWGECPEEPLVCRNPNGYNRHGLVAATVMEAALQALGFNTRLMGRSDLDPRATLATAHNIVEVTGPDGRKYIVDAAYLQFHKDVCVSDDLLPKEPVLVLDEREVGDYVDRTLMPHWRKTYELLNRERGNGPVLRKLEENDQVLLYALDKIAQLPQIFRPRDMEMWARSALLRPWNLQDYSPILADAGFQELFYGTGDTHETYDLIKGMNIPALTSHLSLAEVVSRLNAMMEQPRLNSEEALRLIAQLPRKLKAKYTALLDVDPRSKEVDPCINAYFRSLARTVNPFGRDFRVLYGCSGADATSVLQSTDATTLFFADLTEVAIEDFGKALAMLKDEASIQKIKEELERDSNFLSYRMRFSGAESQMTGKKLFMPGLPVKLLLDLHGIGVDLKQVKLRALEDGAVQIDFPWQYHGQKDLKMRSITYVRADITNPETYPPTLQSALEDGIDAFFMKGAFFAPREYPRFLPGIARALNESGWLMTADKTLQMETFNPEECLRDQHFDRVITDETTRLAQLMQPPFDPFLQIGLLQRVRIARNPGTDISYWTVLNLRRKRDH